MDTAPSNAVSRPQTPSQSQSQSRAQTPAQPPPPPSSFPQSFSQSRPQTPSPAQATQSRPQTPALPGQAKAAAADVRADAVAKLKRAASLPRMKDGRRPAMAMHREGVGVSEGERSRDGSKGRGGSASPANAPLNVNSNAGVGGDGKDGLAPPLELTRGGGARDGSQRSSPSESPVVPLASELANEQETSSVPPLPVSSSPRPQLEPPSPKNLVPAQSSPHPQLPPPSSPHPALESTPHAEPGPDPQLEPTREPDPEREPEPDDPEEDQDQEPDRDPPSSHPTSPSHEISPDELITPQKSKRRSRSRSRSRSRGSKDFKKKAQAGQGNTSGADLPGSSPGAGFASPKSYGTPRSVRSEDSSSPEDEPYPGHGVGVGGMSSFDTSQVQAQIPGYGMDISPNLMAPFLAQQQQILQLQLQLQAAQNALPTPSTPTPTPSSAAPAASGSRPFISPASPRLLQNYAGMQLPMSPPPSLEALQARLGSGGLGLGRSNSANARMLAMRKLNGETEPLDSPIQNTGRLAFPLTRNNTVSGAERGERNVARNMLFRKLGNRVVNPTTPNTPVGATSNIPFHHGGDGDQTSGGEEVVVTPPPSHKRTRRRSHRRSAGSSTIVDDRDPPSTSPNTPITTEAPLLPLPLPPPPPLPSADQLHAQTHARAHGNTVLGLGMGIVRAPSQATNASGRNTSRERERNRDSALARLTGENPFEYDNSSPGPGSGSVSVSGSGIIGLNGHGRRLVVEDNDDDVLLTSPRSPGAMGVGGLAVTVTPPRGTGSPYTLGGGSQGYRAHTPIVPPSGDHIFPAIADPSAAALANLANLNLGFPLSASVSAPDQLRVQHSSETPSAISTDSNISGNGSGSGSGSGTDGRVPVFLSDDGGASPFKQDVFPTSPWGTPLKEKPTDDEEEVVYRDEGNLSVGVGRRGALVESTVSWVDAGEPRVPFDDDDDDQSMEGEGDADGDVEENAGGEAEDEVARVGDDDTPLHSETLKEDEAPSNRTSNVSDAPSSAKEEDGEAPQSPIHPESLASASSPSHADPASAPEASAEEGGHESASSSLHSPVMGIHHFPVPMQQSPYEKSHLDQLNEWELHKKESERGVKPKTSRDGFSIISATFKRVLSGKGNSSNTPGVNTPGSTGRRSRSNSVATRRDVESAASRESATSAISGRVDSRADWHHPHGSDALSLPQHIPPRGGVSPVPPVSANDFRYMDTKLDPFPGMKELQAEQERKRARGMSVSASASTTDVHTTSSSGPYPYHSGTITPNSRVANPRTATPTMSSSQHQAEYNERRLSHQASDSKLLQKYQQYSAGPSTPASMATTLPNTSPEYLPAGFPTEHMSNPSHKAGKLPTDRQGVKQWMKKFLPSQNSSGNVNGRSTTPTSTLQLASVGAEPAEGSRLERKLSKKKASFTEVLSSPPDDLTADWEEVAYSPPLSRSNSTLKGKERENRMPTPTPGPFPSEILAAKLQASASSSSRSSPPTASVKELQEAQEALRNGSPLNRRLDSRSPPPLSNRSPRSAPLYTALSRNNSARNSPLPARSPRPEIVNVNVAPPPSGSIPDPLPTPSTIDTSHDPHTSTSSFASSTSTNAENLKISTAELLSRIDSILALEGDDRRPSALDDPPRKFLHSSSVLQVADANTVKDRILFLFSDILVIAKPVKEDLASSVIRDGPKPPLDTSVIVKHVVRLDRLQMVTGRSADRDPSVLQNDPRVRELVQTFKFNSDRAVNTFLRGRDDPVGFGSLLFSVQDLDKTQLGYYLSRRQAKAALKAFIDGFGFTGIRIDQALRVFLMSIRLPSMQNLMDNLITGFAGRWYEANAQLVSFDRDLATSLVKAIIHLNDVLHTAQTHDPTFMAPITVTARDFIEAFRPYDTRNLVPDDMLERIYGSIYREKLVQALDSLTAHRSAPISVKQPLPDRLTYRAESAPITIRIPHPDPDFCIQLLGHDLLFDPPILDFSRSAEASFKVTGTALGTKSMIMSRSGANAAYYTGLPLSKALTIERAFMRNTIQIAFPNQDGRTRKYMFSLDDSQQNLPNLLDRQIQLAQHLRDSAKSSPSSLVDRVRAASDIMAFRVLQDSLIPPAVAPPPSHLLERQLVKPPSLRTGRELAVLCRQNSLIPWMLSYIRENNSPIPDYHIFPATSS
ncbi:hypothetical protein SISNIDRAFT_492609 [Sistotremastrum niveocremeum HHB9708]|uniref:SEC7 domain-containing protein n=1 Tax=Sistotremastrum niveocremeum HHB9708 TaxID=1314777 RepID=A0A164ZYL5_9AGAM|nr:hypothetical protein SISNIDRAFT_492609 [Sistotremastrum niveocremeum HHB9708]